jgi:hypothetical protein
MYLLLSGEGKTDMGVCYPAQEQCAGEQFKAGAMAVIVDQLVEMSQGYEFSHLDNGCVGFVSEAGLVAQKMKVQKKSMRLRGEKRPAETQYYFENARRLAVLAREKSCELGDTVIAVLFRDADGTASAGRGDWRTKRESMIWGFAAEEFEWGVAMIPKPKSEAWLLCALKDNPYQHCIQLEGATGNDDGKNPLKEQLTEVLNGHDSVKHIKQMLRDKRIDIEQIDMPSFNEFKRELDGVVKNAMSKK